MKKFVSVLTALTVSATAMGGTFALGAGAATNTEVETTIIEFVTKDANGNNTFNVEVSADALATDTYTIPVTMYVPQSSGVNSISTKLSINGGKTIGQYEEHLFGNYGITMTNAAYADPYCFDTNWLEDYGVPGAPWMGTALVTASRFNILWSFDKGISNNYNADSYSAYVATGESQIFTWTEDEKWARDHAFVTFDIVLPVGLEAGTYVLDVYRDVYVNANSVGTDKLVYGQSLVLGVPDANGDSERTYETRPLTITVIDDTPSDTTTTTTTTASISSDTTTTTTTDGDSGTGVDPDLMTFAFIPQDMDYAWDADQGMYVCTVAPNTDFVLGLSVWNDPGTAAGQLRYDFSTLTFVSRKMGTAYRTGVEWNPETYDYVWCTSNGLNLIAEDGSVMSYFTLNAAEAGEYICGMMDDPTTNIIRDQEGVDVMPNTPFVFRDTKVIVADTGVTTTTSTESTTTTTSTESTTTTTSTESTTTTTSTESTTTTTTTESTTPAAGEIYWGDVNVDQKVSIADVVRLNKYLAGNADITDQGKLNADCAYDGTLDSKDATAIKEYLALLIAYTDLGNQ